MQKNSIKSICKQAMPGFPFEALFWTAALLALAFYDPAQQEHVSYCVFNNLGFPYCPGCGLGRSISHSLHADVMSSIEAHPLGMAAVVILVYRSITLWIGYIKRLKLKINNYGKCS